MTETATPTLRLVSAHSGIEQGPSGLDPQRAWTSDIEGALAAAFSAVPNEGVAYVLIDPENLCLVGERGALRLDEPILSRLNRALTLRMSARIRVLCGYSHHWAPAFRFGLPGGRHLRRSGENGGEDVMIEAVEHEGLPIGTTSLVVLSGDGGFVKLVEAQKARGIPTVVVARAGTLSTDLDRVAFTSVTFGSVPDLALERAADRRDGGHRVAA